MWEKEEGSSFHLGEGRSQEKKKGKWVKIVGLKKCFEKLKEKEWGEGDGSVQR